MPWRPRHRDAIGSGRRADARSRRRCCVHGSRLSRIACRALPMATTSVARSCPAGEHPLRILRTWVSPPADGSRSPERSSTPAMRCAIGIMPVADLAEQVGQRIERARSRWKTPTRTARSPTPDAPSSHLFRLGQQWPTRPQVQAATPWLPRSMADGTTGIPWRGASAQRHRTAGHRLLSAAARRVDGGLEAAGCA